MQPFRPTTFKPVKSKAEQGQADVQNDPGFCVNKHPQCVEWASAGECDKNPGYMTGDNSPEAGSCRAACKACETCEHADGACYGRNRDKAGYLDLTDEVLSLTGRPLPTHS